MKKNAKELLILCVLFLGFLLCGQAKALVSDVQRVIVQNDTDYKVYYVFAYSDNTRVAYDLLTVQGWWSVEPHSKKTMNLPIRGNTLYYYAHANKRKLIWQGKGDSRAFPIVNEAFKYIFDPRDSDNGPARAVNPKNVKFRRVSNSNQNGTFDIHFFVKK